MKTRLVMLLFSLCFILTIVPYWSCYSVKAGVINQLTDYEIMRIANDSEISSNLLGSLGITGGITEVVMQDHNGATGRVYKAETAQGGSNYLYQVLSSPPQGTYILSGWSKAENVVRGIETEYYSYALMATVNYTDGTYKDYNTLFSYGTHGWEYRQTSFTVSKPVSSISFYAFLRTPASGIAYFDGLSLRCAYDSEKLSTFQDQPVKVLQGATGQTTKTILKTKDGLELGLGDSEITELKIDGESIKSNAYSGFLVRDIAEENKTGIYAFKPESGSTPTDFKGKQNALGLELNADYVEKDTSISVSGVIADTTNNSEGRAVQLSFALPVTANGWKWSTDILTETEVDTGNTSNVYKSVGDSYLSVTDWDSEPHSYYPVTTVYNEDLGIALSSSMDFPSYWVLEYNGSTNSYVITYQLGIVPESPDAARFDFSIYKLDDPEWGFRSAMKKYSQIHPEYYKNNEKEHGMWLAWAQVDNVINVEDYNIKFKEISETTWLNGFSESQNGIKGYFYFELGDWWLPNLSVSNASGIWDKINSLASEEIGDITDLNERPKLQAIATEFSKNLDINGEIVWNPVNNDWCPMGSQVHINANPALPGKYNFYNLWMSDELNKRLFDPLYSDGTTFDGIYLDELSGWWLGNANFNKEHYSYTTVPLTYSPYYKKAMLHRASTTWEAVKKLSDTLHAQGKTIFANKCPDKSAFYVPLVDAMGTEQTAHNGTVYSPQSIETLSTWRTLAYSKPYCILLNNDYSIFDHDMMEKYFARCLTYAIFPSPCINTDDGMFYFRGPERYYERDRDIFKTYMPAIKECSESGWEPVTYATTDDSSLIIERYGDNDAEGIHYVIYNPTNTDKNISVDIDLSKFTLSDQCVYKEMIIGADVNIENGTYTGYLPAESSICISIKDPSKTVVDDEDDDDDGKNNIGNPGGGNSNKTPSLGGNNIGQAYSATNKITQTTSGGLINKVIKHHLKNNLEEFVNKETYLWTVVLIIVDTLILLSGVMLFILLKKRNIHLGKAIKFISTKKRKKETV